MRNRFATRISRSFDRRKDVMARRVAAWAPLASDAASVKYPATSTIGVPASSVLRVLVVDNDVRAADSLERLLHSGGYPSTRVAYTAHGALAIAADFSPSIALLALDVRDMDAYELGSALWARTRLRRVRLIAVTDSRARVGGAGAPNSDFEQYLLKPITAADLSLCLTSERFSLTLPVRAGDEDAGR
jgi:PleD family two-component response regulator